MVYHDLAQPYRIQKRLVLNRCFRTIHARSGLPPDFVYVTFGGQDLYNAMDLVSVFCVADHHLRIVSYEHDEETAASCQVGAVATTLSLVDSLSVDIVVSAFPTTTERLNALRSMGPFVYFLDYTGTFRENESQDLYSLMDAGLLRDGDFLLITSCLTPRVIHNQRIMAKYDASFRLMFKTAKITNDLRDRSHVDLFVSLALSRFEKDQRDTGEGEGLSVRLLGKYKYQDSRAPMGLWTYRVEKSVQRRPTIEDVRFDEFPHAFAKAPEEPVPNIFE